MIFQLRCVVGEPVVGLSHVDDPLAGHALNHGGERLRAWTSTASTSFDRVAAMPFALSSILFAILTP